MVFSRFFFLSAISIIPNEQLLQWIDNSSSFNLSFESPGELSAGKTKVSHVPVEGRDIVYSCLVHSSAQGCSQFEVMLTFGLVSLPCRT